MPLTRRSRRLGARPDDVWRVVGDPQHLPRWWPRVQRVEADDGEAFTQVLMSDRGHSVRADFRRVDVRRGRRIAWEQEVAGTPFERLLSYARTDIELAPAEGGTEITV